MEDWENMIQYILKEFPDKRIFLLKGNLGAGKTTFVQFFGKALNVKEHITSPTFPIMQEYHSASNIKLYHFDLYRIGSVEELKSLGFEDFLYSENYCFIEWPELIENLIKKSELKGKTLNIDIQINENNNYREVMIQSE